MANSFIRQIETIQRSPQGYGFPEWQHTIEYDTANADFVVQTPAATGIIKVTGIICVSNNATILLLKSGTTVVAEFNLTANSGPCLPVVIGGHWAQCVKGEALSINANANIGILTITTSVHE